MNRPQDFRKRNSGVVVNINDKDHKRARRRNRVRRDQDENFGQDGKIAKMENEIAELKAIISKLVEKR